MKNNLITQSSFSDRNYNPKLQMSANPTERRATFLNFTALYKNKNPWRYLFSVRLSNILTAIKRGRNLFTFENGDGVLWGFFKYSTCFTRFGMICSTQQMTPFDPWSNQILVFGKWFLVLLSCLGQAIESSSHPNRVVHLASSVISLSFFNMMAVLRRALKIAPCMQNSYPNSQYACT